MTEHYIISTGRSKIYAPTILNSDELLHKCKKCGRDYFRRDSDIKLLVEGNGSYPDVLLCGHWPIRVVSERALKKWNENHITGYRSYPVRIFKKNGDEIPNEEASYHYIEITGSNEFDLKAMGIKIVSQCNSCGAVTYNKNTWEFGKAIVKKGAWDGSDLFAFKYFGSSSCTQKLLEVIYNNRLTNFRFKKIEDSFNYGAGDIMLKDVIHKLNTK